MLVWHFLFDYMHKTRLSCENARFWIQFVPAFVKRTFPAFPSLSRHVYFFFCLLSLERSSTYIYIYILYKPFGIKLLAGPQAPLRPLPCVDGGGWQLEMLKPAAH